MWNAAALAGIAARADEADQPDPSPRSHTPAHPPRHDDNSATPVQRESNRRQLPGQTEAIRSWFRPNTPSDFLAHLYSYVDPFLEGTPRDPSAAFQAATSAGAVHNELTEVNPSGVSLAGEASDDEGGEGNPASDMTRKRSGSSALGPRRGLAPLFGSGSRDAPRVDGPSTSTATMTNTVAAAAPPVTSPVETHRPAGSSADTGNGPNVGESSGRGNEIPTQPPSIRMVAHQDSRATRPSLEFPPISRTVLRSTDIIRVGRYSERDAALMPPPDINSPTPVGFKSKVVSRRHCEFWCDDGQWYIKDVKSSSGTFLNHIRLSQPSVESRAWAVNDGDIIQLGIDFKGGEEMIYRCVKMRVECNRGWQKSLNQFNTRTHQRLRRLASNTSPREGDSASVHSSECSICLLAISPCQALFVAPCSHVWHYKCIRPMLHGPKWPTFLCPNCRAVSDLEAEIEEIPEVWEELPAPSARTIDAPIVEAEAEVPPASGAVGEAVPELPSISIGPTLGPLENGGPSAPRLSAHQEEVPSQNGAVNQPVQPIVNAPAGDVTVNGANGVNGTNGTSSIQGAPAPQNGVRNPPVNIPGAAVELAASAAAEGPLTPRNDIGPFVMDGTAGRVPVRRPVANLQQVAVMPTGVSAPSTE